MEKCQIDLRKNSDTKNSDSNHDILKKVPVKNGEGCSTSNRVLEDMKKNFSNGLIKNNPGIFFY